MTDFKQIAQKMHDRVDALLKSQQQLYMVDITKEEIWDLYLNSFPPGTNELYKERREYDCNTCKQFIVNLGRVATLSPEHQVVSIWNPAGIDDPTFQVVFAAIHKELGKRKLVNVFYSSEPAYGTKMNHKQEEDGSITTFHHFHAKVPAARMGSRSQSVESLQSAKRTSKELFQRALETITRDAVETVLELIQQGSLYRGDQWQQGLTQFKSLQLEYSRIANAKKENFCWATIEQHGVALVRLRNSSIGTLLVDLSEGKELEQAVRSYESITAPSNYKRPKEIFTQRMLEQARETVEELGLTRSLHRRFATIDDITVNNVLFANREATRRMESGDVFDQMTQEIKVDPRKFDRLEELDVSRFVSEVLPSAKSVELLVEPKHQANMVSLLAPAHADAKPLFAWGNNFSWAYKGNVADAMKERVKAAGGKVDGVLRFSIQWNEQNDNQNDYDAHAKDPSGSHIYYGRRVGHGSSGTLDVDIIQPGSKPAVENIIYTDINRMPDGMYRFWVHVFSNRGGQNGFRAQIEFDGVIHDFDISNPGSLVDIEVATVRKTGTTFKLVRSADHTTVSGNLGGLPAGAFHPVTIALLSPNYWNGKQVGNKHWMFMLQGMMNDECPNGFFNEYLPQSLLEHKRVFAALGSKMRVEPSDQQLTGLGFSSTKRESFVVRVTGQTVRTLKVRV